MDGPTASQKNLSRSWDCTQWIQRKARLRLVWRIRSKRPDREGCERKLEFMVLITAIALVACLGAMLYGCIGAWYLLTSDQSGRERFKSIPPRVRKVQNIFTLILTAC